MCVCVTLATVLGRDSFRGVTTSINGRRGRGQVDKVDKKYLFMEKVWLSLTSIRGKNS